MSCSIIPTLLYMLYMCLYVCGHEYVTSLCHMYTMCISHIQESKLFLLPPSTWLCKCIKMCSSILLLRAFRPHPVWVIKAFVIQVSVRHHLSPHALLHLPTTPSPSNLHTVVHVQEFSLFFSIRPHPPILPPTTVSLLAAYIRFLIQMNVCYLEKKKKYATKGIC